MKNSKVNREILEYYSREDILEEMLRVSKNREFVESYEGKRYGKRPQILINPSQIIEKVKKGATSFHYSVEIFSNPLLLDTKEKIDNLRIGWDLVIDIDCKSLDLSKEVTLIVVKFLRKKYKIENIFCKYSGNKGFHLIIPFEAFPNNEVLGVDIVKDFSHVGKCIIKYIRKNIQQDIRDICEKLEYNIEDVEIDPNVFNQRHLIRMPYSINEKSMLVSLPIKIESIKKFKKEIAEISKVKTLKNFLVVKKKDEGILKLIADSLLDNILESKKKVGSYIDIVRDDVDSIRVSSKVPKECFPPCINKILKGLEDGKKRALFILITFLYNCNYSKEEIEDIIKDWNNKNEEKLKESYIKSQLKWFFSEKGIAGAKKYLPPNCDHPYIQEIGICEKDEFCYDANIKNPLTYALKKFKLIKNGVKGNNRNKRKT